MEKIQELNFPYVVTLSHHFLKYSVNVFQIFSVPVVTCHLFLCCREIAIWHKLQKNCQEGLLSPTSNFYQDLVPPQRCRTILASRRSSNTWKTFISGAIHQMICKTRYKYFIIVQDVKKILQKLKFIALHIHHMIRDKLTPKNLSRRHCGRCQSDRDGRPAPRGEGGKMIKTAGKLRGIIKTRISNFSNRGNQYDGTMLQQRAMPNPACQ